MPENIIWGINMVNPTEHVDISRYKPHVLEDEPAIYVIEMPTSRAKHLGNKLIVFGRLISEAEHQRRERAYAEDPKKYFKDHLLSLGS